MDSILLIIIILVIFIVIYFVNKEKSELSQVSQYRVTPRLVREEEWERQITQKASGWGYKEGTIQFDTITDILREMRMTLFPNSRNGYLFPVDEYVNMHKDVQRAKHVYMAIKIVSWGTVEGFKNNVAKNMKIFAETINFHDPEMKLKIENILKNNKQSPFPILFTFFTECLFTTPFGEEFDAIDKEVNISLDNIRQIKSGFNGNLLHLVSRVEISQTPIDTSDMSFEEKVLPGLVKGPAGKRKAIDNNLKQTLLAEANYSCQECGARLEDGATLEIDHIIPISKGGTDDYVNLQILCATCNREKGASL